MNSVIKLSKHLAKTISETTDHVNFLAVSHPEISANLQTIVETLNVVQQSLQTVCELSEMDEKNEKKYKQIISSYELILSNYV